jgi:hypothetical protein
MLSQTHYFLFLLVCKLRCQFADLFDSIIKHNMVFILFVVVSRSHFFIKY